MLLTMSSVNYRRTSIDYHLAFKNGKIMASIVNRSQFYQPHCVIQLTGWSGLILKCLLNLSYFEPFFLSLNPGLYFTIPTSNHPSRLPDRTDDPPIADYLAATLQSMRDQRIPEKLETINVRRLEPWHAGSEISDLLNTVAIQENKLHWE